jgi:hypothetical protein
MKPHRGTLILVLGILSLVVCGLLGIFVWVMGSGDLKECPWFERQPLRCMKFVGDKAH